MVLAVKPKYSLAWLTNAANCWSPELPMKHNNANILHWSSTKCKRITWSVLASELYGIAHGFDTGVSIKHTIELILQIDNLLWVYTGCCLSLVTIGVA
jgi:hypothetical protein